MSTKKAISTVVEMAFSVDILRGLFSSNRRRHNDTLILK